jgi:phosphatidylglycerophosphate synthase
MQSILYHLTTIAVAAVFVVLLLGLWNMMRGHNANLSQKLMRWRVGLQFVAIVIIMAFILLQHWSPAVHSP